MNKIIKSQNRIETKYISNSVDINQLLIKSIKFGFIKTYPKRYVYSLYYDDENVEFIRRICNIEIELFGYEFDDRRSS